MKKTFIIPFGLIGLVMLTLVGLQGCIGSASGKANALVGTTCVVQFRDALGTAASAPVPPLTGNFNGSEVEVSGKVKSFDGEWVVLEHGREDLWISTGAVLLIQVQGPTKQ